VRVGRSVALLLAGALAGGAAMAVAYGVPDGALTALLLLLMGVPVLAVLHLVARHRRRLGSLSWQLGAGVALVIGLDLVGIQVVAMLLFVSAHDAFTLGVLLAFAGVLAGYAAQSLTREVTRDVARVRDAVVLVGEGERPPRIDVGTRDELAELAMQVDRMNRELAVRAAERDAAEQARRDLVAAVSHDLRTPLSALRLIAGAIEDGIVDERSLRDYLGRIASLVASLDTLIEDLFELARLEAGDVSWSFERLALEGLVRETVEGMAPVARAAGVELSLEVAGGLPPVRANPEKIQRVLFNLIDNALRNTPRGGRVQVTAHARGEVVEVRVIDTGGGIAPTERERVFEPLFRGGPEASRPRGGAGLGLPISRTIVEAHGGSIRVAESSPAGTRIAFTLPVAAS